MYKFLRYALVLTLVPTLALSQDKNQGPCPDISVDLSGLSALSEIKLAKLENMEGLTEQIELAVFESLESLEHLEDLDEQIAHYQTGDVTAEVAAYDVEKRKTIDKTYKVSRNDMLNIENKFGKIHINTWNKNEVHVKVDIIARCVTESMAQEILDKIKVMESREGSTISFRTHIEPMRVSGNNNKSFEVNYTISMPEENALTVKNSFGDVYLAALKGKADINVKYGALKCDRLSNPGNTLTLAYGSGSCGYFNGGSMDVSYGNMNVEGVNGLQGSSKFSDFKIGSLGETMEMDIKYGTFAVNNISKNIRKITLSSGFTPINLTFDPNTAFNFDVNVQFGDFRYDKSLVNITSLEKGHTSAEYRGAYGGASPKGLVSVNSKYGDVKFMK
ncbi:DUF4097 domain-containing protein [Pontibacter pamirensis]|uniref:DUF4097 domain-containing protein n=1 Tax=Pontibacter pamirensis TaxID=2562824 RepID=UPI001F361005|nr:DUF4097 domain-containing protein [Pontibacter pamirensis]